MKKQREGGGNLNLKVALLFFLVLFASTITTVITTHSIPLSLPVNITKTATYNINPGLVQPTGDPIDNPVFPC